MKDAYMQWHRLDREWSLKILDMVKSVGDPWLFSRQTTEVKRCALDFYDDYMLYRLTNFASLPLFSMDFLGNGRDFVYLDGSAAPIYGINDTGALALNEFTALPYLNFFFEYVSGPEDDVRMIGSIEDFPSLSTQSDENRSEISRFYEAPSIRINSDGSVFVETALLYAGSLVRAEVTLSPSGRVSIGRHELLLQSTSFRKIKAA